METPSDSKKPTPAEQAPAPRKRLQFSLATLLLAVIATGASMGWYFARRDADARVKPGAKEQALLQERAEIASKLHETLLEGYKNGFIDETNLSRAELAMYDAKLALCKSKEERINIYEQMLAAQSKREALAEARIKAGMATADSLLRVRLDRLETEAKLEREKAGR